MRESFKGERMDTKGAVQRDLEDAGINNPGEWREALDLEIGDANNEPQQERRAQLLASLESYWNRERETEKPWMDVLDSIEVRQLMIEKHSGSLEDAKTAIEQYSSEWKEMDVLMDITQETLKNVDIQTLMHYGQTVSLLIERIADTWRSAASEYWYQKTAKEKYQDRREAFGIDIYNLDVLLGQSQEVIDIVLGSASELKIAFQRFHSDKKSILSEKEDLIKKEMIHIAMEQPDVVKQSFQLIHDSKEPLNDHILDELLGIQADAVEEKADYEARPFSRETLRQIAQQKKITIVALGPSVSFFDKQDWLKPSKTNHDAMGLTIYESV